MARRSPPTGLALVPIVAVGVALRAWHLNWGLPEYNFPDDVLYFIRPAAIAASGGAVRPGAFIHPPGLTLLLTSLFEAWAAVTGTTLTVRGFRPVPELIPLTMVARAGAVAAAGLSIGLVHAIGRRLLGSRGGLLAAAALAVLPLHVLESHRVAPDVFAMAIGLGATALALRGAGRAGAAFRVAAGVVAGLAAATRYTAGIVVAVPAWGAFQAATGRRLAAVVTVGIAALAGFVLMCLPWLPYADRFIEGLRRIAGFGMAFEAPAVTLGAGWTQVRWVYDLVVALPYAMGWPLWLAALGGLVLLWRRDRAAAAVLVAVLGPYLVIMGSSNAAVPRYWLQATPFLVIAAAAALDRLWTAGTAARTLVVAVGVYTALLSVSHVRRLDLRPQRAVGREVAQLATAASAAGAAPLVVAYPDRLWLHYDAVAPFLRRPDVRLVALPPATVNALVVETKAPPDMRAWLAAEGVGAIVVPRWVSGAVARLARDGAASRFLADLEAGRLGFERVLLVGSPFLTDWLYTWGDPILETHWETGITGYAVFARAAR